MKNMNNKGVKAVTLMLTLDEMYRAAGCEPYVVSTEHLAKKTGIPAGEVELLVDELAAMTSKRTLKIRIPGINLRKAMTFEAKAVCAEKIVKNEPLNQSIEYKVLSNTGLCPGDRMREFVLKADAGIAAGLTNK